MHSVSSATSRVSARATPLDNLHLINLAFGENADLYVDVLQLSARSGSEEVQMAYFDRRKELFSLQKSIDAGEDAADIKEYHSIRTDRKLDAVAIAVKILGNSRYRQMYDRMKGISDSSCRKIRRAHDSHDEGSKCQDSHLHCAELENQPSKVTNEDHSKITKLKSEKKIQHGESNIIKPKKNKKQKEEKKSIQLDLDENAKKTNSTNISERTERTRDGEKKVKKTTNSNSEGTENIEENSRGKKSTNDSISTGSGAEDGENNVKETKSADDSVSKERKTDIGRKSKEIIDTNSSVKTEGTSDSDKIKIERHIDTPRKSQDGQQLCDKDDDVKSSKKDDASKCEVKDGTERQEKQENDEEISLTESEDDERRRYNRIFHGGDNNSKKDQQHTKGGDDIAVDLDSRREGNLHHKDNYDDTMEKKVSKNLKNRHGVNRDYDDLYDEFFKSNSILGEQHRHKNTDHEKRNDYNDSRRPNPRHYDSRDEFSCASVSTYDQQSIQFSNKFGNKPAGKTIYHASDDERDVRKDFYGHGKRQNVYNKFSEHSMKSDAYASANERLFENNTVYCDKQIQEKLCSKSWLEERLKGPENRKTDGGTCARYCADRDVVVSDSEYEELFEDYVVDDAKYDEIYHQGDDGVTSVSSLDSLSVEFRWLC